MNVVSRAIGANSWMFRSAHIVRMCRPRTLCIAARNSTGSETTGTIPIIELTDLEKELQLQVEKLSNEKQILVDQVADFHDKYQRSLADRENLRMRLEKQITDAKQFGIQGFCKDLLEVSDVFRKAIESVPEEQLAVEDDTFKGLYEGLTMTESNLLSVFRRHGLSQITPATGEKFNPADHEAMLELADPTKISGTIALFMRVGWRLHDRCIRSAQVGVVRNP